MPGFNKKDVNTSQTDSEFLGVLKEWHDKAKDNRRKFDWRWYLYDNYYRGNHYIQFNKRTNQIVTPPRPRGQVRMVVNKIYAICRAVRNFATSYRPHWEVTADATSEEDINNSRKASETLDYYYDHLGIPRITKGVSLYVIKYGIGFLEWGWDDEKVGLDNQMGDVDVWERDPFDVYLDPAGMETGDIQECRYVDIVTSKPVQDIVGNPNYKSMDMKDVQGDTRRAASEFKQIIIQNNYSPNMGDVDELKSVLLHETQYKKRVKRKTKKDEDAIYDTEVWIASWIEGHLLRNENTGHEQYNLITIPSDNNPGEIYGEGYIKNLIPLNKILNRLESQVVEYNNIMNRGRIYAEKGAGVSKITNETGEIIEYNTGSQIKEASPGGLSPDIHNQIARINNYMDEISGVRDAFKGDVPSGVTSGVAIEQLRAQSANNLQDLKDNIETALAKLGEGILDLIASKVVVPRQIRSTDNFGKEEESIFKVKGQVGVKKDEKINKDTYVIGKNNKVKVTIGSGLAYTKEGRTARLDKMLDMGVIDPQTYLERSEFGDIKEVYKRVQQMKIDNMALESAGKTPPPGTAPGTAPVAPEAAAGGAQGEDNWLQLAEDENEAMMNGEDVASTQGAPKEHTSIHVQYSQSDEAQTDDALLARLLDHIKGEEQMQGISAPPGATEVV